MRASEPVRCPSSWPVGSEIRSTSKERSPRACAEYSHDQLVTYLSGTRDTTAALLEAAALCDRELGLPPPDSRAPRCDGCPKCEKRRRVTARARRVRA
jgi:hypothetical protein